MLQVELDFTSYTAAMKQAGWLVRTVSVTYGSPFVTLLEVAAPVATASFITGLFAYISGGRSARKKQRAEADIADVLSRLAEEQQTAQLQESQAKARLAIAEARLKEIEVERAETRRNTKHHQRLDAEREKLLNLLAAFELLKNYGRTTDIAWQTEDYARLLAAPGLAAALRVLESSDVEADLLE